MSVLRQMQGDRSAQPAGGGAPPGVWDGSTAAPTTPSAEAATAAGALAAGAGAEVVVEEAQDAAAQPRPADFPPTEDEVFANHMSSAVQNFLAGGFMEESESEGEDDPARGLDAASCTIGATATPKADAPSADASPPASEPESAPAASQMRRDAASFEMPKAPSPASGVSKPVELSKVLGLPELGPRAAPVDPNSPNAQDFLKVLQRRALPVEITEESLPFLKGMLLGALNSLYMERLWPVQSHMERRLRELGCDDCGLKAFLFLCARDPATYTILPPMNGNQPVILLAQEPAWFKGWVDVESAMDEYSTDLWLMFCLFAQKEGTLKSYPYQAAMQVKRSAPQLLGQLSLGELEHMVRLACGKRRLLAVHGDALKPTMPKTTDKVPAPPVIRPAPGLAPPSAAPHVAAAVPALPSARVQPAVVPRSAAAPPERTGPLQAGAVQKQFAQRVAEAPQASGKGVGKQAVQQTVQQQLDDSCEGLWTWSDIQGREDLMTILLQLLQKHPDGMSLSNLKQIVQSHCQEHHNEAVVKYSKLTTVHKLEPPRDFIFPCLQEKAAASSGA